jgi:SWIM/SEC-C metal-binding protein
MGKINYGNKKIEKPSDGGPRKKIFEGNRPPKLGTEKNPARVRVRTEERMNEVTAIFEEKRWKFAIELEPDKPEDTADMESLLHPPQPVTAEKKVGRNEPCPCGSGKKFKKCCER